MIFRQKRTVAVVGLTGCGKTTLLTSLIDHLEQHDPERFPLGPGGTEVFLVPTAVPSGPQASFDFVRARAKLSKEVWPEKTLRMQSFCARLTVRRGRKRISAMDLTLLDLPGERLADVEVAASPSYDRWCEWMLRQLEVTTELEQHAEPFRRELEAARASAEADPRGVDLTGVVRSYREFLARLIVDCIPFVTPSSFWVNAAGEYVPESIRNETDPATQRAALAGWGCCGADRSSEFVPLPGELRSTAAGTEMAAAYDRYRNEVVRPVFESLAACDRYVVLVDVAEILQSGVGWKNVTDGVLRGLVDYVDGHSPLRKRVTAALGQFRRLAFRSAPPANRVVFVATQSDRVHRDDRSRLRGLLEELARPAVRNLVGDGRLAADYVVCAAVDSTRCVATGTGDRRMQFFQCENGERIEVEVTASEVPDEFPTDDWRPGRFQFPRPAVRFPANRSKPPFQFGLDRLAERLISG